MWVTFYSVCTGQLVANVLSALTLECLFHSLSRFLSITAVRVFSLFPQENLQPSGFHLSSLYKVVGVLLRLLLANADALCSGRPSGHPSFLISLTSFTIFIFVFFLFFLFIPFVSFTIFLFYFFFLVGYFAIRLLSRWSCRLPNLFSFFFLGLWNLRNNRR